MTDILDFINDEDDDLEELEEVIGTEVELYEDQMSEARAQEITEAIRATASVTFALLAQAHQHKAHKALGYDTWEEYVRHEFDMSAQRSYQLLDLHKVIAEIETVVPDGTTIKLTEAQARDIKRELPRLTEEVERAVEDGEDPEDAVNRVVDEIRTERGKDDADGGEAKKEALDSAKQEGYQSGLEAAADALLEEAAGESATLEDEGGTGDSVADLSSDDGVDVYNFFNVLAGVKSLPEPDDFISVIPASRRDDVTEDLTTAVEWINRFSTLWEIENEDTEY